ncbi:MAG: FtsW/RodA/SpoVE family cell cycle protein [bacterium]|nr:FtsW/RodA/SpoVE family cell cycle protein [bacterium]
MPLLNYLPIILIYLFGLVNLFGIRPDLLVPASLYGGLGIIAFTLIRRLNIYRYFFRSNASLFYWVSMLLLVGTYFFGVVANGSRRWLDIGLFQFQPSELLKIFLIVFLAQMFARKRTFMSQRFLFLSGIIYTAIPTLIIFLQPDLGSALILGAIFMIMALHARLPTRQLVIFFSIIIVSIPLIWFTLHDYQKDRIQSFIYPQLDSSGASYNMSQAIIAVGSGGVFGKGLGLGKQTQLRFLPEYHTDFAFSSLIEQFGLLGGLILISLYIVFFGILFMRIASFMSRSDPDEQYKYYYTIGFSAFIIIQTCVNIGMNVGLLPVAGITLPFISYGGSSLITFIIGLALLP